MNNTEAKKPRGILFYALLCACLGVWGYVLYQVARGVRQQEPPDFGALAAAPGRGSVPPSPALPGPGRTYDGGGRDPFAWPSGLFAPPSASPPLRTPRAPPEPPPVALRGVVDGTALLHREDGSVYVARAGEQAGDVRVLRVHPDHVVVRFRERSHTLRLIR